MMDAVLSTVFDGVQAIRQKQSSSRIKLINSLAPKSVLAGTKNSH
jgi:hypothetical protein